MFGLIGTFDKTKIDWPLLKTSTTGLVKVFCKAWVTPGEWDDMILPPIIASAVDDLQSILAAKIIPADGGPLRFGDLHELQENGPPVLGFLRAQRTTADVEKIILECGGKVADFPPLVMDVMRLVKSTDDLNVAVKAWVAALKS